MRRALSVGLMSAVAVVLVSAPGHATPAPARDPEALANLSHLPVTKLTPRGEKCDTECDSVAGVKWTTDTTCVPGSIRYAGAYRVYDDAWLESSQCVTTNGTDSITITSPAVPSGGTVVAYPSIRFGAFYTDGDPQSGLPLRVTRLGGLTLHVASTGRASAGGWQSDVDAWFHPTAASIAHHHGTFELVISNRYAWRTGGRGDPIVRVGGRTYRWASWITCQRLASGSCDPKVPDWRIAVFWRTQPKAKARIRVAAFAWFLIRQGLMSRHTWLGDMAYGTECWSGAAGLTDSMTVTGAGVT